MIFAKKFMQSGASAKRLRRFAGNGHFMPAAVFAEIKFQQTLAPLY